MKIRHCGGRLLNLGESYRLPHGAYTERLHARRSRRNQTTRCRSQSISCGFSANEPIDALIDLDPMRVAGGLIFSLLAATQPAQSILCRGLYDIENPD